MKAPETSPTEPAKGHVSAAGDVLLKLDKAVRMRRFYDASHDIVRRFEEELLRALRGYLDQHGDLSVRVRPTTFELGDDAIEAPGCDEFALAFFRQGVIALRFQKSVPDDEFVRFINVCALGLQSNVGSTDDLPSLLWQGNFEKIQYAAPVGYTEEDGSSLTEDDLFVDQETVSQVIGESLSIDLDRLPPETRKAYEARVLKLKGHDAELTAEVLSARTEVANETAGELARRTFGVVRAVASMPRRGPDLSSEDLARLFSHFRKLFLDTAALDALVEVADATQLLLDSPTTSAEDKAALRTMLDDRLDEHALTDMLARVPGGTAGNVDKVARLIQVFGGNDRSMVAKLADLDESEGGRSALDKVLGEVAGNDPEFLINRFRSLEGKRAVEALALLARVDLAQARMAVAVRLPGASDETQLELLEAIHALPNLLDERMQSALIRLAAKGGTLRDRILESFAVHPHAGMREAVLEWVKAPDLDTWEPKTVAAAFRLIVAAGEVAPVLPLFTAMLERKSLFGRKQLLELKLAVIHALALSEDAEAHALLQRHAEGKDKDLATACREAIERIAFERSRGIRPTPTGGAT